MKRSSEKLIAVSTLFSLLLLASLALHNSTRARMAKRPPSTRVVAPVAETGDTNGLTTTKFTTSRGTVTVNQPDDMTAGDTLSGTVTEEPAGKTEKERAQNQDELKGYVVEMENQKAPVSGKTFKWNIPATFASTSTSVVLRDRKGKELARSEVPVSPNRNQTERPSNPTPNDYLLPTVGQAGRPIQVHGPCDGDFATTNITVGGIAAQLLAESPRKIVAESPKDMVGSTEIECQEQGLTAKGPYRNLAVKLSANTNLRRGQQTPLDVKVSGLEGLEQDVTLRLENRSANIVELGGGSEQTIVIHPGDVQAGGIYDTTRTLTAKQVGAFDIVATLFGIPGVALHLKAQSEKKPKPTPTPKPEHVKDVSYPPAGHTVEDHVKGVSWGPPGAGPHVKGVTWGVPGSGDHVKGKTWPKDTGGSVPGGDGKDVPPTHLEGVTWPPKGIPGQGQSAPSWAKHVKGVTWPPYHVKGISWPPHQQNLTWPPEGSNPEPGGNGPGPQQYDWPKHLEGITWPPTHIKGTSPPGHTKGVTWPPYHIKGTTDPKHQKSGTWPKGP